MACSHELLSRLTLFLNAAKVMSQHVSSLNLPNNLVTKLHNLGFYYVKDALDDPGAETLCQNLGGLSKAPKTLSAFDLYKEEILNKSVLTFNKELDDVLADLIAPGLITEFVGLPGCGKTQVCFNLAVSVQLPEYCGGLNGQTIYVSANNNFAPQRVRQIAEQYVEKIKRFPKRKQSENQQFLRVENLLKGVHFLDVKTPVELKACALFLETYITELSLKNCDIKLIIIDSLDYIVKQLENDEKVAYFTKLLGGLRGLGMRYKISIVVTNNMFTNVDKNGEICVTPSLRDVFYHNINNRVVISKQNNAFKAEILKNCVKNNTSGEFQL